MVVTRGRAFWRALEDVEAAVSTALRSDDVRDVRAALRVLRRDGGFGVGVEVEDVRAAAAVARSRRPDWLLVERYLGGRRK